MSFNWGAKNYREIVNDFLGYRNKRRPRGAVKQLAERLRCHSTFVSQVLSNKADFSPEQAFEICQYLQFTQEEQYFFLTLLARDRSGTAPLKQFYQNQLDKLLEARRDLKPKTQSINQALTPFQAEYFCNWTYQAIHALTQIESFQAEKAIAEKVRLPLEEVTAVLNRLRAMGLVKYQNTRWQSLQDSLHLGKDSPYLRQLRASWKTKLLSDLQRIDPMEGTRYSGVITISSDDFQKVRNILVEALNEIRKVVEKSKAEEVYLLSIDCYTM